MESNKESARKVAHQALELADNISEAATNILRSLRRGNDAWELHVNTLHIHLNTIAEAINNVNDSDDAEDARAEEA